MNRFLSDENVFWFAVNLLIWFFDVFYNAVLLGQNHSHRHLEKYVSGYSKKQYPKSNITENFLPLDTHTYVFVSGGKKSNFFGKFFEHTKWMIPIITRVYHYRGFFISNFANRFLFNRSHWLKFPNKSIETLSVTYLTRIP